MMDPHSAHADIAAKRERYRTSLEAHGHSIAGREIPMARLLAVAETDAEAEEIARRGVAWTVGAYANPSKIEGLTTKGLGAPLATSGSDPVQRYLDGVALHGSPEKLVDQLQGLHEEMFLDYLLCAPLSHSSFVLFTERVLPKLL